MLLLLNSICGLIA